AKVVARLYDCIGRGGAMNEDLTPEELHQAVDRAVEELLELAGVTGPPVDASAVARKALGLTIQIAPEQPPKRSRRAATGGAIVLPASFAEEKRQWAVAREIGARLKPAVLDRLGLSDGPKQGLSGESVANLFAVRLLLPTRWFAGDARSAGWDV